MKRDTVSTHLSQPFIENNQGTPRIFRSKGGTRIRKESHVAQSFLRCRRMESDSGELESLWDSKKRELSQEMVQEMVTGYYRLE